MRVLLISGEFPPMQGGVGDYTNEIAKGLAACGEDLRVLSGTERSGVQSKDQPDGLLGGIEIRVLTSTQAEGRHAVSVLPLITRWNWRSLRRIAQCIREFAPDVVHIQYQTGAYGMHPAINFLPQYLKYVSSGATFQSLPDTSRKGYGEEGAGLGPAPSSPNPLLPLPLGERAGVRGDETIEPRATPLSPREGKRRLTTVVTFHDLRVPYLFPKAGPVRDWVTRHLAKSADAVIATNETDYLRLVDWNVRQTSLIPIGSNLTTQLPPDYDRRAWRARLNLGEQEPLLCHFGFINARKGCDTLVRALAEIPNAKLLMIGGQTGASDPTNVAYLKQIQALIAELGLNDRVLWTGFTSPEQVTAAFLASDFCVLPYREGASYQHGTLMAAIAHAVPIVTTKVMTADRRRPTAEQDSLPRLLDGENCLLAPPDDPAALVGAIRRALASTELRARISAGARTLAQHFTWDKIVQQHLELYQRVVR